MDSEMNSGIHELIKNMHMKVAGKIIDLSLAFDTVYEQILLKI